MARVGGPVEEYTGQNVWGGKNAPQPGAFAGKSYGMLSVDGTLSMWLRQTDSPSGGGATQARLATSTDHGAHWSRADWDFAPSTNLISPTFLNFGQDYSGARDDYVYTYFVHSSSSDFDVVKPGMIDLARAVKGDIMDRAAHEFFNGIDPHGDPIWSTDVETRQPVFEDANGVGWTVSVSYNAGLGRYLLMTEHQNPGSSVNRFTGNLGLFDAPEPWGPWTTVEYTTDNNWSGFGSTFFWNFSNKWTSADGLDTTLVFTGTNSRGSNDSWNTIRGSYTLVVPEPSVCVLTVTGVASLLLLFVGGRKVGTLGERQKKIYLPRVPKLDSSPKSLSFLVSPHLPLASTLLAVSVSQLIPTWATAGDTSTDMGTGNGGRKTPPSAFVVAMRTVQRSAPRGGALAGQKPRVLVSTDIGGSDPDDFQSMVHLLIYGNVLDIEGLIASPPQAGRARHIRAVIDTYEKDYASLKRHADGFPEPGALRHVTRQGAVNPAPAKGWGAPTEGSRWIIQCAKKKSTRPLWVLVWGSITDVAQAVHDDPSIKQALRMYSIGSWNTRMDQAARDYLYQHHADMWWIESNTTFRGMYVGGKQNGPWSNRGFVNQFVQGHGALGKLFFRKKPDIKMGDTPSLLYLLRGDPDDPATPHWGGAYVKTAHGDAYWTDDPSSTMAESGYAGAKTVSRWRVDFLGDWRQRMNWIFTP